MIPNKWKQYKEVWSVLLEFMLPGALIRNLGKMTSIGMFDGMSVDLGKAVQKLTDKTLLKASRVHPLNVLNAIYVYSGGRSLYTDRYGKPRLTWNPNARISGALEEAFYLSFDQIEPANKRTLIALDVSGSMAWPSAIISGTQIHAREASAAMAMITARQEPVHMITAFSSGIRQLNISPTDGLKSVLNTIARQRADYTVCSKPMEWALQHKIPVDTFIIYTDSETNGGVHVFQALKQYRSKMGIDSKLVVVGMVSNRFTLADPDDDGMMDCVGFDTAAPTIINAFSRGEI